MTADILINPYYILAKLNHIVTVSTKLSSTGRVHIAIWMLPPISLDGSIMVLRVDDLKNLIAAVTIIPQAVSCH